MTDEEDLMRAYRAADLRGKKAILEHAKDAAMEYPLARLSLVPNRVRAGNLTSCEPLDGAAPSCVSAAV